MCDSGWNALDVNGTFVSIVENDFFVASDGTVYKAPHQAGETMYRYDDNRNRFSFTSKLTFDTI